MYSPSNTDKRSLSTTNAIIINQFKLNFLSMPYLSNFCMLIPQQTSTTKVRTAREINTKMEGFFMREIRNTKIIAVDHGYGNIKTTNTVTPTGITAYETEPIFTENILEYNGTYYRYLQVEILIFGFASSYPSFTSSSKIFCLLLSLSA